MSRQPGENKLDSDLADVSVAFEIWPFDHT